MPTIPVVTPVIPDFVNETSRKFGVVGVKTITNNGYAFEHEYTGVQIDNLLTFLDVSMIDAYYKATHEGTTTPLTPTEMLTAGFGTRVFPNVEPDPESDNKVKVIINGNEYTYDYDITWLDVEYNDRESYTDNPFKVVTLYDLLITTLCTRTDVLLYGDITLDATFGNTDYTWLTNILGQPGATTTNSQMSYLFTQLQSVYSTDDVSNVVFKTYQTMSQGPMYQPQLFTSYDDTIYTKSLDNIFKVTRFPTNSCVIAGTGTSAEFEIVCTATPTYDVFHYEWLLEDSEGNMVTEQLDTLNTYTIISPDVDMDGRTVQVIVYDQIQPTVPAGTPYSDTTYFQSRTYTTHLYVNSPTLWGDVNGDGVVNVVDAYRIINNFIYKKGDCNEDGLLNSLDASLTLKWYSLLCTGHTESEAIDILNTNSTKHYTLSNLLQSDMNMDNVVDNVDASLIQQCYSLLYQGKTEAQIYTLLGVRLTSLGYKPRFKDESSALVKSGRTGPRPTQISSTVGNLILNSVKNNDTRLY